MSDPTDIRASNARRSTAHRHPGYGALDATGRCKICSGLIDEDDAQSKEHIEKSTRVILGLLSHYSDTLVNAMKRAPPGTGRKTSTSVNMKKKALRSSIVIILIFDIISLW